MPITFLCQWRELIDFGLLEDGGIVEAVSWTGAILSILPFAGSRCAVLGHGEQTARVCSFIARASCAREDTGEPVAPDDMFCAPIP